MNVKGFKLKCLQLFDTFNVRFGVMLVGPTGGGKSTCFSVLQHAFNSLDSAGNSQYNKVKVKILNPKSISMGERRIRTQRSGLTDWHPKLSASQ